MGILKWYIIKEWLKSFLAAFSVLFVLITVANLLTGLLRSNVTIGEVLSNYTIQIFNYLTLIIPISSLTASMFSINKIKSKNELTAIFSLGISRRSYLFYIFLASLFIGFLSFITLAFIKPKMSSLKSVLIKNAGQKFMNLKKKGLITSTIGSGNFWYKTKNYFIAYKNYNHNQKKLNYVSLYQLNNFGRIDVVTQAKEVIYQNSVWKTNNAIQVKDISKDSFNKVEVLTKFNLPLIEKPADLLRLSADINTLNIIKLKHYINNLEHAGINTNEYKILFYSSFNIIFMCILLSLVASIDVFQPNRRSSSSGKSIGKIFLFTICYWLVRSYLIEMGKTSNISAEAAVFITPILILLFFLAILFKNRKLN